MYPLSFVIAFGILGVFTMVGALMMVMSGRRLLKLAGNPVLSWQHLVDQRGRVEVLAAVDVFLLTMGIVLLTLGVRGIYRVIWVAP